MSRIDLLLAHHSSLKTQNCFSREVIMSESIISALIQAPFVMVTVYLVHRFLTHLNARDSEWRGFTNEMHEALGERVEGLTEAIDRLSHLIIAHDAATRADMTRAAIRIDTRPDDNDAPTPIRRVR
jgi:hypothetical protein